MFASRLRSVRMYRKLTQQKMADLLSVSLNSYQKYEQQERSPALDTLVRIADLLDVSVDYLLCRDEFIASRGWTTEQCFPSKRADGSQ